MFLLALLYLTLLLLLVLYLFLLVSYIYRLAANIIFTTLSLILNYSSLKLAIAVYRGLPIGRPLPYIPCNPYTPI
jgi:hypothetical protein